MHKMKVGVIAMALLGLSLAGPVHAAESAAKTITQEKCPVMGLKIDPNVYTDYEGKRIYFCCSSCLEKFKSNPQEYLKKMKQ